MKKILFLSLFLVLFLSLSFNAFALGEDYLFTSNYWYTVFDNTSTRITYEDETFYRGDLDPYSVNLSIDNVPQDEPYIFSPVLETSHQKTTRGRLYLPVGIELIPNQTVYLSFVFKPYMAAWQLTEPVNFNLTFDDSIAMSTEVAYYDDLTISNLPDSWDSTDPLGGFGYIVTGTYTNTSDSNITLTSLTFYYESSEGIGTVLGDYGPLFYFGVPVSNSDPVVLPSYVETNLINIGNLLRQQISKMDYIISYIDEIQGILDLLLQNSDSSSSVTNNFYDKVINPSPEQSTTTEELKQLLQDAKDELVSMRETIETVTVPQLGDINTVNMSSNMKIEEALTSDELSTVLSSIFNSSSVVTMLLLVISVATIGYIMFGKKA